MNNEQIKFRVQMLKDQDESGLNEIINQAVLKGMESGVKLSKKRQEGNPNCDVQSHFDEALVEFKKEIGLLNKDFNENK